MTYPLINGAVINGSAELGPPTTQGIMSTRFGVPSLVLGAAPAREMKVPSLGQLTSLGDPNVEVPVMTALAQPLSRTTRFGQPQALMQTVGVGGVASLNVASLGAVPRFGTATARTVLSVEAVALTPSSSFGTPGVGTGHTAAGFRSTSFGAPAAQRGARATGLSSTCFGAGRASRIAHPASLPGLRFGKPRVAGYSHAVTEGFSSTEFGVPSTHSDARALPVAPSARFGRPTIVRNSLC